MLVSDLWSLTLINDVDLSELSICYPLLSLLSYLIKRDLFLEILRPVLISNNHSLTYPLFSGSVQRSTRMSIIPVLLLLHIYRCQCQ